MRKRKSDTARFFAPFLAGAFLFFAAPTAAVRATTPAVCAAADNGEDTAAAGGKFVSDRLPRGVKIDGVLVGGMNRKKAAKLLRRLLAEKVPKLTIKTPKGSYTFAYPQIGFSDDLEELLLTAEKNGEYASRVRYFLNGEKTQTDYICDNYECAALDAEARFSSEGFVYEKERAGVFCDRARLQKDVAAALCAEATRGEDGVLRFPTVALKTRPLSPKKTEYAVKRDTKKLSSFTTYFNEDDKSRSGNIALAARRIDGTTVRPEEEFSFNAAVGARTKENGFQEAKVIQDGEFIIGVGGGVCQASTTLYNAAVLAGLKITSRKPHSLAVHYVEPSRDAMVSSYSDFKFKNTHTYPVYLSMKVRGDAITVTFYGRDEGYRYKIVSEKIGEVPPPDPVEKIGNYEGTIREGKAGIKSQAYLETYLYGKLVKREKLRTDTYAPIRGIVGKKRTENK